MRTTLNLRDDLFEALLKATGAKTKTEAVHAALIEYLRWKKLEGLIALSGKVHIDYDWKAMRALEIRELFPKWTRPKGTPGRKSR